MCFPTFESCNYFLFDFLDKNLKLAGKEKEKNLELIKRINVAYEVLVK